MANNGGPTPARCSRRRFLKNAVALVASGVILPRCGGKTGSKEPDADSGPDAGDARRGLDVPVDQAAEGRQDELSAVAAAPPVFLGLYPGKEAETSVRELCQALDWSWLKPGDSVFVKVSCNSENPHPAVTSPAAVRAVCKELFDRGAAKVYAGDQGGIESVRLDAQGKKTGSTLALMQANGLAQAIQEAGATPWCFEDHGYADGYFPADMDFPATLWPEPPQLARIVEEVDHVVLLPRLSSHMIAGYSHALKCGIGWLRDDSRCLLHFNGAKFHAMYAEVNYCRQLLDRQRLVLTCAEKLLLDCGPDDGTVAQADPLLVLASSCPARHDAVAVAALAFVDSVTPKDPDVYITYGENADAFNQMLFTLLVPQKYGEPWAELDMKDYTPVPFCKYQEGVAADPALARAFEILGGAPEQVCVHLPGAQPDPAFAAWLEAHDGGRLALVEG